MVKQVEITSLDLRYESCRMRSNSAEQQLLVSMVAHGIRDSLQGVETKQGCRILLDGFKRYRCAKKLNIGIVPYQSLDSDEAVGIIKLLRMANAKSLSILEQARLIDELKSVHKMSVSQIAKHLERSKGWVGMRVGLIGQMSKAVMDEILSGKFPVYSYMYTIRTFMRMNGIKKQQVDEFVNCVSGKGLSIRDIEILANGYFKGGEDVRQQIKEGNISWALSRLKHTSVSTTGLSQVERRMLTDLEIIQRYMQRVVNKSQSERFKSATFFAQANLLTAGILRQLEIFARSVRQFHDKCRQAGSDLSAS
jgi:hypothetical protein